MSPCPASPNILKIETAKIRALTAPGGPASVRIPTPARAWDLITRGNSDALGWTDAGRLEVGALADLLVLRVPDAWMDEFLVGRLIYGWDHSLIETRILRAGAVNPDTI